MDAGLQLELDERSTNETPREKRDPENKLVFEPLGHCGRSILIQRADAAFLERIAVRLPAILGRLAVCTFGDLDRCRRTGSSVLTFEWQGS